MVFVLKVTRSPNFTLIFLSYKDPDSTSPHQILSCHRVEVSLVLEETTVLLTPIFYSQKNVLYGYLPIMSEETRPTHLQVSDVPRPLEETDHRDFPISLITLSDESNTLVLSFTFFSDGHKITLGCVSNSKDTSTCNLIGFGSPVYSDSYVSGFTRTTILEGLRSNGLLYLSLSSDLCNLVLTLEV